MKTMIVSLSLIFASSLLPAQNYQQAAIQLTNVIIINNDNTWGDFSNEKPQVQVKMGNPFGFKAKAANKQAAQPKPKPKNKPKPVIVQKKEEPIEQMQLLGPGINPGAQAQNDHMDLPEPGPRLAKESTAARQERAAPVKKLGIPLKYRLRYKRIRVGEKKAFRSGGGKTFKANKRQGTKEKCFFASL